jgi:hypothetical protein
LTPVRRKRGEKPQAAGREPAALKAILKSHNYHTTQTLSHRAPASEQNKNHTPHRVPTKRTPGSLVRRLGPALPSLQRYRRSTGNLEIDELLPGLHRRCQPARTQSAARPGFSRVFRIAIFRRNLSALPAAKRRSRHTLQALQSRFQLTPLSLDSARQYLTDPIPQFQKIIDRHRAQVWAFHPNPPSKE